MREYRCASHHNTAGERRSRGACDRIIRGSRSSDPRSRHHASRGERVLHAQARQRPLGHGPLCATAQQQHRGAMSKRDDRLTAERQLAGRPCSSTLTPNPNSGAEQGTNVKPTPPAGAAFLSAALSAAAPLARDERLAEAAGGASRSRPHAWPLTPSLHRVRCLLLVVSRTLGLRQPREEPQAVSFDFGRA